MARYNLDVLGQVGLERLHLRVFAGGLAAYDGANLGCYTLQMP